MKKVYVSPSATRKAGYSSRYFLHLKRELASYFEVLEADNAPCIMQSGALLRNSFKADVAVLSFVENIAFHKLAVLQTCIALIALGIMRLRKCRTVFIFHNPSPHQGGNALSRALTDKLFRIADLVVAHTENTASIARERVGEQKVLYFPHPCEAPVSVPAGARTDVLIWGTVLPYKGVEEFISNGAVRASGLKIKILGACPDPALAERIHALENDNISFEQRRAEMDEIASNVAGSRFVLFPYLPGSISGSGTLVDTLRFGGNPVGPDVGAFAELSQHGLCRVYADISELLEILHSPWSADPARVREYLSGNSWTSFVETMVNRLKENV